MARENQGLQIGLIIFVMLTIILGVTTYLFFRQYEEATIKANNSAVELAKVTKLAAKNDEDANELKRLIGMAKTEKVDAITSTIFSADMKKYGASYPEVDRFYRPLLERMSKTIDEKNAALALVNTKLQKYENDFSVREAQKQPQIDQFKQAAEKASTDLDSERGKFKNERDRLTETETSLKTNLETAHKEIEASQTKLKDNMQVARAENQKLKGTNQTLSERLGQVTSQKFDVPEGEIRWVNQRAGTVWIDLGRADALQRQVTFAVYPADITDMAVGSKKGSIEVTQVLGDHLAEARVIDDKLVDPIISGDKLYTPVWTPGEKRHFALAGFMDVDGDGRSDLQTVLHLIAMNGGVVDSYIDEKGKRVGQISVNTRYLVLGDAPTDKGQADVIAEFSKMRTEAQRLGVQQVQLVDLLQRMGWKNQTPTVQFGRGANPKDFAPKAEEGVQRSGSGVVSDVFKARQPPAGSSNTGSSSTGPSNSYYRFGH
jgi:regulator of replication initiation timing